MNKNKNYTVVLYTILMILFAVAGYLFIYAGLYTKSREYVSYKENSDVEYTVYLKENDIYDTNYLSMNGKYISELVKYIDFKFNYNSDFSENIYGYYLYNVDATLVAYEDNIKESLWEKEYTVLENKVVLLNENNIKNININDNVKLNYDLYKNELINFIDEYEIDVNAYLKVNFNLEYILNFNGLEKEVKDSKKISLNIPLSDETFKIDILNNYDDSNSYYDFSTKNPVNYLFLISGVLSLIVSLIVLILLILEFKYVINLQSKYTKELRKIFKEYDDIIVNVKRFYNKKKYNLIYVDSFSELIDVYNRVKNPISYREVKKNMESIFVIIDDDNAWIYRLISNKK